MVTAGVIIGAGVGLKWALLLEFGFVLDIFYKAFLSSDDS